MKKIVLKLDLHDDKIKQKAMKSVSGLTGVDSITMDMKDKKLTVTGEIDPVTVVAKLRKLCQTDIVSVGPAKEPEKKKEEPKKDDNSNKKDSKDNDKKTPPPPPPQIYYPPYQYYYQPQQQPYYHQQQSHAVPSHYYGAKVVEDENPNACAIC